jgi:NADPH:quinone reductase-like Zn-dependent oxidoreductase
MMAPPQKIKQWLTGQDGLDKLRLDETECPTPGQDEVLVEIHAVSLNYRDTEGTLKHSTSSASVEANKRFDG